MVLQRGEVPWRCDGLAVMCRERGAGEKNVKEPTHGCSSGVRRHAENILKTRWFSDERRNAAGSAAFLRSSENRRVCRMSQRDEGTGFSSRSWSQGWFERRFSLSTEPKPRADSARLRARGRQATRLSPQSP